MTRGGSVSRIPQRVLVTAMTILRESRRLVISTCLAPAGTLAAELASFRVDVAKPGHRSHGAGAAPEWREGAPDDHVLTVALAAWFGGRDKGSRYYRQEAAPFGAANDAVYDSADSPTGAIGFGPFGPRGPRIVG